MVQIGYSARFRQVSAGVMPFRHQPRMWHFHRDGPIELLIASQINQSEPTPAP